MNDFTNPFFMIYDCKEEIVTIPLSGILAHFSVMKSMKPRLASVCKLSINYYLMTCPPFPLLSFPHSKQQIMVLLESRPGPARPHCEFSDGGQDQLEGGGKWRNTHFRDSFSRAWRKTCESEPEIRI